MNQYGIRAAWQWVAKTTLSDGRVLVVRSKSDTRTPDYQKPTYLPGGPEDLAACSTPVATAPAPVAAIAIESAAYGGNCGAAQGNVSADIACACNGKRSCDCVVDYTRIGDPAPGCAKEYQVAYQCGNGPRGSGFASPEAGFGSVVRLACN